jgi:hypothetical protein
LAADLEAQHMRPGDEWSELDTVRAIAIVIDSGLHGWNAADRERHPAFGDSVAKAIVANHKHSALMCLNGSIEFGSPDGGARRIQC